MKRSIACFIFLIVSVTSSTASQADAKQEQGTEDPWARFASDIGPNRFVMGEAGPGWLVPVADRSALAGALREAWEGRSRLGALGRAARDHVRSEFALPRVMDLYEDLFRSLLRTDTKERASCA